MKTTTSKKMVEAMLAQAKKDLGWWIVKGIDTTQKKAEIEAMEAALAAMG